MRNTNHSNGSNASALFLGFGFSSHLKVIRVFVPTCNCLLYCNLSSLRKLQPVFLCIQFSHPQGQYLDQRVTTLYSAHALKPAPGLLVDKLLSIQLPQSTSATTISQILSSAVLPGSNQLCVKPAQVLPHHAPKISLLLAKTLQRHFLQAY